MTTIRLLDARRGLNRKCEELFGDARIAEAIYRFLCDGIEECEDAEPEQKRGKWLYLDGLDAFECSVCGRQMVRNIFCYCPWCGADMREESEYAEIH